MQMELELPLTDSLVVLNCLMGQIVLHAAWVKQKLWDTLTPAQKKRFVPICPDFVIVSFSQ